MSITCKEMHRLNGSVNIGVLDDNGAVIYDRYVDAEDWGNDPQAIMAQIADYLANRPAPLTIMDAVNTSPIVMTTAEVNAKLGEIETAKQAEAQASVKNFS